MGQGGVMRQALCGALQQELRDYYRLMAILEAQSQQAPPSAAAAGAPPSSPHAAASAQHLHTALPDGTLS